MKAEAGKPLFLITACEELRLQAQYGLGGTGVDDFITYVLAWLLLQTTIIVYTTLNSLLLTLPAKICLMMSQTCLMLCLTALREI
mgnify:CR=1 FL=1